MIRAGAASKSVVLLLSLLALRSLGECQTFSVLDNLGVNSGGPTNPGYNMVQARDGNLYGTSPGGGKYNYGTVFKLTPAGKLSVLHSFQWGSGAGPYGGLTLGTDGVFYGITEAGGTYGNGTVFKMTSSGQYTVLYNFTGGNDGQLPWAPPIEGTNGLFYGTTTRGGANGWGTVYAVTTSGKLTTLYALTTTEVSPQSPLLQAASGLFYGVSPYGGGQACGEIFSVTAAGRVAPVYLFDCSHGGSPYGSLIQAQNGIFYGTASGWGKYGNGSVYTLTAKGTYVDLYDFEGTPDGGGPYAPLIQATDGEFYGVTAGTPAGVVNGTIYKISAAGKLSVLYSFDGTTGANPYGGLIQHTNGAFYGATVNGGTGTLCNGAGCGTLYRLDVGLKPFVALLPGSGVVGASVGIIGQGFVGTTKVSFNGVSATFRVMSGTFLTATVPEGATTGVITVTTPSGVLKSNRKFRIR